MSKPRSLTPEQKAKLNEAAVLATELYVEKMKEVFPDSALLREALTGHTHVHSAVAVSEQDGTPLLGLHVVFDFASQEELDQMIRSRGQA